jgi:hypothetical protein
VTRHRQALGLIPHDPTSRDRVPRLKADPSAQDLDEIYTLTPDEIAFIDKTVKRPIARSAAFIYLKLFQRLGYFVHIRDVPSVIRQHIVAQTGYRPARPMNFGSSTERRRAPP